MVHTLTVTEAVRHFSEYVNRVAYRHEAFILRKGRKAVAELRPVPSGRRLGDLPSILAALPMLSASEKKGFGKDLLRSHKEMNRKLKGDPWVS